MTPSHCQSGATEGGPGSFVFIIKKMITTCNLKKKNPNSHDNLGQSFKCDILRTTTLFWAEASKFTKTSFITPVQMQVTKETQSFTSALQGSWSQAWQCGPEEGPQPTLCEALVFENHHWKKE